MIFTPIDHSSGHGPDLKVNTTALEKGMRKQVAITPITLCRIVRLT